MQRAKAKHRSNEKTMREGARRKKVENNLSLAPLPIVFSFDLLLCETRTKNKAQKRKRKKKRRRRKKNHLIRRLQKNACLTSVTILLNPKTLTLVKFCEEKPYLGKHLRNFWISDTWKKYFPNRLKTLFCHHPGVLWKMGQERRSCISMMKSFRLYWSCLLNSGATFKIWPCTLGNFCTNVFGEGEPVIHRYSADRTQFRIFT